MDRPTTLVNKSENDAPSTSAVDEIGHVLGRLAASVDYNRQCWVCFGDDSDEPSGGEKSGSCKPLVWLSPCKCSGSTKWVHEQCLQRWIDEKAKSTSANDSTIACSQCNAPYVIIYPRMDVLQFAFSRIDLLSARVSPYLTACAVTAGIYWTAATYGAITVMQIYGIRGGLERMERVHPVFLLTALPTVPVALVALHSNRWRVKAAHSLYKCVHRDEFKDTQNMRVITTAGSSDTWAAIRNVCTALALPSAAVYIGEQLFIERPWTPLQRAAAGAGVAIGVHAVCSIYYRYCQVYRGQHRQVLNYPNRTPSPTQNDALETTVEVEHHDDDSDWTDDEEQYYAGEFTPTT